MIRSLLIANRGEIACRIIRTARRLGIVLSPFTQTRTPRRCTFARRMKAVHIGPSPARESYLVGEKIIAAARQTGAEAIHPGYGFLSENADFAQAVIDAGLIWVGPNPPRSAHGPQGRRQEADGRGRGADHARLSRRGSGARPAQAEADAIGYPVLIKAVAGGGGKGMRRVNAPPSSPTCCSPASARPPPRSATIAC
jgi:3-methylcrotonyl-CoA carboxylase alpha subunit